MLARLVLCLFVPFAAGWNATTVDATGPNDSLIDPTTRFDGRIERVVVTFDAPLANATIVPSLDDFEVVGYVISSISVGAPNTTVWLDLLTTYSTADTDATPTVRFFSGTLQYANSTLVFGTTEVSAVNATDGAPPVLDYVYGGLGLKPGLIDAAYLFSDLGNPTNSFWATFSEPVNLQTTAFTHFCCSPAQTWGALTKTPVGGTLASTQFAQFSNFNGTCTTITTYCYGPAAANIFVNKTTDAVGQFLRFRKPAQFQKTPFLIPVGGANSIFQGGLIINDTTANNMVANNCSRISNDPCVNNPGFTCDAVPTSPPLNQGVARSLDLNGDGRIDHIWISTQSYRWDSGDDQALGSSTTTVYTVSNVWAPRLKYDNWIQNPGNGTSWTFPNHNVLNAVSKLGYVLLTINETGMDTAPVADTLTFNAGQLLTWTGNEVAVTSIPVLDGACPVLLRVTADGGANNVTLDFSEPVTLTSGGQFTSYVGSVYYSAAFANVSGSGRSWKGILSQPLNYTNFGGSARLRVSGRPSLNPACPLRRNYLDLGRNDNQPPHVFKIKTQDGNKNGKIDGIQVTFNENIVDSTVSALDFSLVGFGPLTLVTGVPADDNILDFTVTERGYLDGGDVPQLVYSGTTIVDLSNNLLAGFTNTTTDGVAPVYQTVRTSNNISLSERIEQIYVTWTEPVSGLLGSSFVLTNIPAISVSSVNNLGNASAVLVSASAYTGATPLVNFSGATGTDSAGNFAGAFSVVASDFARPSCQMPGRTLDTDNNGHLDRILVQCTENVVVNVNSCTVLNYTVKNITAVTSGCGGFGYPACLLIDVTEKVTLDGIATPVLNYTGNNVTDLNGNLLVSFASSSVDGVPPFLTDCSATIPNINAIDCQFTEANMSTAVAADFVLGGPLTSATISSVSATNRGTGVLSLVLSRPLVLNDFKLNGTIDLPNNTTVMDQAGNKGIPRLVKLRNTDTTGPSLVKAVTRDLNCNGQIDAIEVDFSEGVLDVSLRLSDYSISGVNVLNLTTGATPDDKTIRFLIQESGSVDSDVADFNLTYTPGLLTDLSENPAFPFTYNVTDGAGPALKSAVGLVDSFQLNLTFYSPFPPIGTSGIFTFQNTAVTVSAFPDDDGRTDNLALALISPRLRPLDFTTPATINAKILDAAGNLGCGIQPITNPDKTAPTITFVGTADRDANLHMDSLNVNFSEPIDDAFVKTAEWTVQGYSVVGTSTSATFDVVTLSVTEVNASDVAGRPVVTYTQGSLTDRYGNLMASQTITAYDRIPPRIVSAVGKPDDSALKVTFSEPVYGAANSTKLNGTDFVYYPRAANGNAIASLSDDDGSDGVVVVQLQKNLVDVSFTGDTVEGQATLFDLAGNPMAGRGNVTSSGSNQPSKGDEPPLSEGAIIGIAAGGGGFLLLIGVAVAVVLCRKRGGGKGKGQAFDQNQVMNEFDFGTPGASSSTEMAKSSSGASKLEP